MSGRFGSHASLLYFDMWNLCFEPLQLPLPVNCLDQFLESLHPWFAFWDCDADVLVINARLFLFRRNQLLSRFRKILHRVARTVYRLHIYHRCYYRLLGHNRNWFRFRLGHTTIAISRSRSFFLAGGGQNWFVSIHVIKRGFPWMCFNAACRLLGIVNQSFTLSLTVWRGDDTPSLAGKIW